MCQIAIKSSVHCDLVLIYTSFRSVLYRFSALMNNEYPNIRTLKVIKILLSVYKGYKDTILSYYIITNNSHFQLISSIVLWSSVLYIISFIGYYLLLFPPTWSRRILYATPFFIAPVFIFLINRYVNYLLEKRLVVLVVLVSGVSGVS